MWEILGHEITTEQKQLKQKQKQVPRRPARCQSSFLWLRILMDVWSERWPKRGWWVKGSRGLEPNLSQVVRAYHRGEQRNGHRFDS